MKLWMESTHELEVKNHSEPPAGPFSWVFYSPQWVSIGKNFFSSKVLVLYSVRKFKGETVKIQINRVDE